MRKREHKKKQSKKTVVNKKTADESTSLGRWSCSIEKRKSAMIHSTSGFTELRMQSNFRKLGEEFVPFIIVSFFSD